MNTNSAAIMAAQTLVQSAGYNISPAELSAFMAVAGAVVHLMHQIVNAGGIVPVVKMIWNNKPAAIQQPTTK